MIEDRDPSLSELFLTIVAIRLAALVLLVGLARFATPAHPHPVPAACERACAGAPRERAVSAAARRIDGGTLGDLLLHD